MKVFISWSGERSKIIANSLRDWIPLVLHYVEPWLSEADLSAGDRWVQEVAKELEASNFGIICVTPENINSQWILFEAGALAKSMQGSKVIPLLFNLEFSDISGPLAQFQAKKITKAGLDEVILSINQSSENIVQEVRAKELFNALWPKLEATLTSIPRDPSTEKHTRPQQEIIEELVTSVRGLDSKLGEVAKMAAEESPRFHHGRRQHFNAKMIQEIAHMLSEDKNDPILLLMWAGLIREDLPWLAEIIVEAYHEIKTGDRSAVQRFRQIIKSLHRKKFIDSMGLPRDTSMLIIEFSMLLEHYIDRLGVMSDDDDLPF